MVVPTPSFQDLDLSDGWTENGSPTFVDDLWNTGTAFDGDGIDDSLQQAEIITDNATPKVSYALWINTTTTTGGLTILGQMKDDIGDRIAAGCCFLQMNANGTISAEFFTTKETTGAVFSSSTNAGPFYNDGVWHHILITADANDVNVFIDGSEVTYQAQDSSSGGGFSSIDNSSQPLSIGNQANGTFDNFFKCKVTRPKIWLQTVITAAEALEEFNNEVAAQIGGSPNIKAALFTELTTDAAVSALVSNRVFPDYADQSTVMPYITYDEFSNQGVHNFLGVGSLDKARYQISIWTDDPSVRTSVEVAVRKLLDGQARLFGTGITATVVTRSENTNNQDFTTVPDDGSQNVVFQKAMDFEFWHLRQ